jgi:transposase
LITTSGHFCQAVAATFKVSVMSVVKWSQHLRAASSASAKKAGGRQP